MASVDPPLGLIAAATVAAGLAVAGILALAGRGLPDPAGRRADAIYLFTVLAVARFLALFSAVAAVRRAIELVVGGPLWAVTVGASAGWHAVPAAAPLAAVHPRAVATYGPVAGLDALPSAIAFAVLAVAAGLALAWHARRARELVAEPGFAGSAAARVYRAYLGLVCGAALVVLVFASASVVLGLLGTIFGGGVAPTGRGVGLVRLVSGALLAAGAAAIFRSHWARRGEDRAAAAPPAR